MILGARHTNPNNMYRRKPVDNTAHSVISGPLRALELAFQEADTRKTELYRRGMMPGHPTLIEHGPLSILLCASPTPDTLDQYASTLSSYNVKHVVRVCEPTYNAACLRALGFEVHDWAFTDGDAPPDDVVARWLHLVDHVFHTRAHARRVSAAAVSDVSSDSDASLSPCSSADKPKETIAVHCVAGLGRAPVLAATALVELGMNPFEAVGWIRVMRRGAINSRQMAFLEDYSHRPPPTTEKPQRVRSRSGSFVGMLFPSLKGARPFRPRTPPQQRPAPAHTSLISQPRQSSVFAPRIYGV